MMLPPPRSFFSLHGKPAKVCRVLALGDGCFQTEFLHSVRPALWRPVAAGAVIFADLDEAWDVATFMGIITELPAHAVLSEEGLGARDAVEASAMMGAIGDRALLEGCAR